MALAPSLLLLIYIRANIKNSIGFDWSTIAPVNK